MALAIITTLVGKQMAELQELLDRNEEGVRLFQIQRISVYAIFSEGDSLLNYYGSTAKREALDWQADPDDVQDDLVVLQHLQQQAATVPLHSEIISGSDRTHPATTLFASVHSSSFAAKTRGRLLPSFHRCSLRRSNEDVCSPTFVMSGCRNFPPPLHELSILESFEEFEALDEFPTVLASGGIDDYFPHYAFVQWQVDVVDLLSRRYPPTSRPAKRRQTAVNVFKQVSDSPVVGANSRGDHPPHGKRFNGVRYRLKQTRWEATMKPPKFQNKQYIGSFKVEAQAARAVDAAFHHYGRPDLLNFPHSSPQLLATRPAARAELDENAKLRFVKDEAKWLASVSTDLPLPVLPSNSLPAPIQQASSSICPFTRFRSISEISWTVGDCGGDEADDAVSQPGPWMQLDALGHVEPSGMQNEQPLSGGLSSVQITEQDYWDGQEVCRVTALPRVGNSSACEMQSSWLDSLLRLSPAPVYPLPSSPRHFEEEMALAWLERQS